MKTPCNIGHATGGAWLLCEIMVSILLKRDVPYKYRGSVHYVHTEPETQDCRFYGFSLTYPFMPTN